MLEAEYIENEQLSYEWTIEEAIADAEKSGFEVVRSTDTTLLLDLDDPAALAIFSMMMRRLERVFRLKEIARWRSKSKRGLHVLVECASMPFQARVALQSCLGSDPMREALAIAMALDGKENPSVLFKPKRAQRG